VRVGDGCGFCFWRSVSSFLCSFYEFLFWASFLSVDEGTGLFGRGRGLLLGAGNWAGWGVWRRRGLGWIGFVLGLFFWGWRAVVFA